MHNTEYVKQKFESSVDMQLYAIEEGLLTVEEAYTSEDSELSEICENVTKRRLLTRNQRKGRVKDHKRSRIAKKAWKHKRKNFEKGIKKFHKSVAGKRLHQKVARNRKKGVYRNVNEHYTGISSLLTHLSISTSYTSSINEEADMELLMEEGNRLLLPVLECITENLDNPDFEVNAYLDTTEAGEFIDDVMGISSNPLMNYVGDDVTFPDEEEQVSEVSTDSATTDDPADTAELTGDDYSPSDDGLVNKISSRNSDEVDESLVIDPNDIYDDINESIEEGMIDTSEFEYITEAAGDPDVDGEDVIAKITGPAFFPNTVSRNRVEYSDELWDKTLSRPELLSELEARRVYGTIGHGQELDDNALLKGLISHITTRVWKDPATGRGMATHLILSSEPGKMLKRLFGAKSKVRVSTRCRGKYLTKRNARGNKVPNPDFFFLKSIDFVRDPGYLEAEPSMVQS